MNQSYSYTHALLGESSMKFTIERFKKDGTALKPVKVKEGLWVEPHKEKQEGCIYYTGTLVPHIHYIEAKKLDKFNQLKGSPMPWTNPSTIWVNKDLLEVEDIYSQLEKAKEEKDKKRIEFLSQPLIKWTCPMTLSKKAIYAQGKTISNANDKSDFVYFNLKRFEKAIVQLEEIYKQEGIKTERGISALINLLSSKFCFRVGNNTEKRSGIGITTFKPQHITLDDKGRIHFSFIGKKHVRWHKIFEPENEIEKLMYDGLLELKNKNMEFLFWNGGRVTSGHVNILFDEVFNVKKSEQSYLSFHSWRHYNASKALISELSKMSIKRKLNKILKNEKKNDEWKSDKKNRLLNRSLNQVFKKVAKGLNDSPGIVKRTYAGGEIMKQFFLSNNLLFDDKKRKGISL